MRRVSLLTVAIYCLSLGTALAQAPQQALRPVFSSIRGVSQEYRLGMGDALEIQVVDAAELNQSVRISGTGEANFMGIGPIRIAGLTASEVETQVAAALKERGLVRNPQVLVFISEYRAKRIYLSGELLLPGEVVMSQRLTVLDAILIAGGFGQYPARYAFLHRHVSAQPDAGPPTASLVAKPDAPRDGTKILKIDLQPVLEGKPPEPDLVLEEGDYLIVPRKQLDFYFVLGEVTNPSNFPIPEAQRITVSQAISRAGGPLMAAKSSKCTIVRKDQTGKQIEIPVDFPAIMKGEKKDIEVLPNDVVFIPSSRRTIIKEDYITKTDLMLEGTAFRVGRYYQMPSESRTWRR
jgi:polysaccharide biosynthesis/export protein